MKNVVRLTGKDRIMQRSILLPRVAAVTVNEAFGSRVPSVLVTEAFAREDGRQIETRRAAVPLQRFLRMV
ncbi:MAG: hypothetical protein U1A72_11700 [Sulfuritalea sp.]|nr:hypothetical protein [Sulfuritalea sp.]